MPSTQTVIEALSLLAPVGQALLVLAALSCVPGLSFLRRFMQRYALAWMFVVALVAMSGSLYLSDIANIDPCKLCWLQRICMYPIVALTAVALWKRDPNVAWYVLPLAVVGAGIAGWHYGEHVWTAFHPADPTVPCSLDGVSCAKPPYWHFGYVTIPLMALTAFALELVGCAWLLRRR